VTFTLSETEGNISVEDGSGGSVAANIAVLFFSAGPNGNLTAAVASAHEDENLDTEPTDPLFVDKDYVPAGAAQPEFDDILHWISSFTLKAKMVDAERLPE
jgi:hypothetical protein